jgi:hypothetical protein
MGINLRKDSCTDKLIKENVNVGQWILVLDDDGIQRPMSAHSLKDWSFFFTNNAAQPQGEELGRMYPLSNSSFN